MQKYLRAIGFSKYKTRDEIRKLLQMLQSRRENRIMGIHYDYGEHLVEIRAPIDQGIGICFLGGLNEIGEFERDNCFPYLEVEEASSTEPVTIFRHTMDYLCNGSISDNRLGMLMIFRLDNVGEYLDRSFYQQSTLTERTYLSGFSISGKIIMEIEKTKEERELQKRIRAERERMINAARNGDVLAIENISIEEMRSYAMANARLPAEDLYSIVETSFMPYGMESEIYSILGNILDIGYRVNPYTKEEIYIFKLECNDIILSIAINAEDLEGEAKVGRRFKGIVWLLGRVEFEADACK